MVRRCKCGGKLYRTDLELFYSREYKRDMVRDTDPLVAHFACDHCDKKFTQRKRQPRVK